MKRSLFIIIISLLSYHSSAQITYKKGYFIDDKENRTECLIKDIDWKNNPTKFQYKLSEGSESKKKTIKTIKEFGVSGLKYIRATINIDRSKNAIISSLSVVKNPIFKKEQLFLKLLVEGKTNLYYYEDGNLKRFFFKTINSSIEQLVYKRFLIKDTKIGINNMYKQQLINILDCKFIPKKNIIKAQYHKKNLVKLFLQNNNCGTNKPIKTEHKKTLFNLNIRPGINITSFTVLNKSKDIINLSNKKVDFGTILSFRFGIEAEFVLPFNNNKWSLLLEPTYNHFKAESETLESTNKQKANVNFTTFEIPMGIRHYFFINDRSKIFVNAAYVLILDKDSKVTFEKAYTKDILFKRKSAHFSFGIGYNFKNKFSIEYRLFTKREVFDKFKTIKSSDFQNMSFILGYTLF